MGAESETIQHHPCTGKHRGWTDVIGDKSREGKSQGPETDGRQLLPNLILHE